MRDGEGVQQAADPPLLDERSSTRALVDIVDAIDFDNPARQRTPPFGLFPELVLMKS